MTTNELIYVYHRYEYEIVKRFLQSQSQKSIVIIGSKNSGKTLLVTELCRELKSDNSSVIFIPLSYCSNGDEIFKFIQQDVEDSSDFVEQLKKSLSGYSNLNRKRILIIDDIEIFEKLENSDKIYDFVKQLVSPPLNFSLVMTSRHPISKDIADKMNMNIDIEIPLGPLSREEIDCFLKGFFQDDSSVTMDEKVLESISKKVGGFPYLLNMIAEQLLVIFERKYKDGISSDQIERFIEDSSLAQIFFNGLWDILDQSEKETLNEIVGNESEIVVKNREQLTTAGFLSRTPLGEYSLEGEWIRKFIREKKSSVSEFDAHIDKVGCLRISPDVSVRFSEKEVDFMLPLLENLGEPVLFEAHYVRIWGEREGLVDEQGKIARRYYLILQALRSRVRDRIEKAGLNNILEIRTERNKGFRLVIKNS